nr:atp-dependent zinc metalloprotease ftsh 12, chloroplastic [Quercus suber]
MAESDSVGPEWLEAVMVKTRRVREEGNWVCLEDANVKVGEFVGRAKEGVSKGQGELEQFRTELVPEFVSWNR